MRKLKLILLSSIITAMIITLPLLIIILPICQHHTLLNKEEKLWRSMQEKFLRLPIIMARNNRHIQLLQKSIEARPSLQTLEEDIRKNELFIDSMQSFKDDGHEEVRLKLKGKYRNFLRFCSEQVQKPNAMKIVYLSLDEKNIEILFKENDL